MSKIVAITGSTGGLGSQIVKKLAKLGYDLILLNRNLNKTLNQIELLKKINSEININYYIVDLEFFNEVKKLSNYLNNIKFDYLILNSAIYNCKLKQLDTGYNNVFSINFITNYYLVKELKNKLDFTKIIILGSVAYNMAKLVEEDIDYNNNLKINKIYGNSKRFLMFSIFKEFENDERITIAHPGITYTNLTKHYPKWINWLVCLGIKLFFPRPKKASNNILYGIKNDTNYLEWIGPNIFNVFGKPKIKKIKNVEEDEINKIHQIAEEIYNKLK